MTLILASLSCHLWCTAIYGVQLFMVYSYSWCTPMHGILLCMVYSYAWYTPMHGVLLCMVYSCSSYSPHHLDQLPGQQRGPASSDKRRSCLILSCDWSELDGGWVGSLSLPLVSPWESGHELDIVP